MCSDCILPANISHLVSFLISSPLQIFTEREIYCVWNTTKCRTTPFYSLYTNKWHPLRFSLYGKLICTVHSDNPSAKIHRSFLALTAKLFYINRKLVCSFSSTTSFRLSRNIQYILFSSARVSWCGRNLLLFTSKSHFYSSCTYINFSLLFF